MENGNHKEKEDIRREIRKKRALLDPLKKEEWDKNLTEQVLAAFTQISVSWVYLYMDFRREAGTRRILEEFWKRNIHTALPRVEGRELAFYPVSRKEELTVGCMGILEPSGSRPINQKKALVFVPGMAFDLLGNRMGYGGGFYDRFFAREPEHIRWGLAYEFQVFSQIPHEKWDQKVERIFTPERVIVTKWIKQPER